MSSENDLESPALPAGLFVATFSKKHRHVTLEGAFAATEGSLTLS